MHTKLLFLIILFFSLDATCQDQYPGYIITLQNDTISGELIQETINANFSYCQFMSDDDTIKRFLPSELKGFKYQKGRLYVSQVVEGSFIHALVIGKVSLYTDGFDYFVEKDEKLYPLKGGVLKSKIDGQEGVKEDHRWRGILSVLVGDCLYNSNELVSRTLIQEKSLSKLISKYNKCAGALQYSTLEK